MKYILPLMATIFTITMMPCGKSWAIVIPEPGFCYQATLMSKNDAYQDPKLGLIDLSFWYKYNNEKFDTIPQVFSNEWVVSNIYKNVPEQIKKSASNISDGKQTLKLDKLLVKDESEGCYCAEIVFWEKCWCNGPWANWWMEIYPMSDHPICDLLKGGDKISCQHSAFLDKKYTINPAGLKILIENPSKSSGGPFTPGTGVRKSHISGPTLNSEMKNCEWYEVGTELTSSTGEKYIVGPQYIDYDNYILWDWDNWCYPITNLSPKGGKCADALWITFKESDEGVYDDYVLTDVHLKKGKSVVAESSFARAWFQDDYAWEDFDGDGLLNEDEYEFETDPKNPDTDGDGLKDGKEINTTKTDPKKQDTDGDGLSDGDEVNKFTSDPLDKDTDKDGIDDGDEVNKYGTFPSQADSDGDGTSDSAEIQQGLSPTMNEGAILTIINSLLLDSDAEKSPPPSITGIPIVPVLKVPKNSVMTVPQNTMIKSDIGISSVKMECGGATQITGAPIFVPAFSQNTYSFHIVIGPVMEAVQCQISATDLTGQTTKVPFQVVNEQ